MKGNLKSIFKDMQVVFNSIDRDENHRVLETQEFVSCKKCGESLYDGSNQEDMQDYFEITKTGDFYCNKCFGEILIESEGSLEFTLDLGEK